MMDWKKLLSATRVRQLYEGGPATRLKEDPRTEFDRDYGRTIFSTPVRRLQDKAQVFPLERCDAIRTRLTHSNEVSSVARNMAEAAAKWMLDERLIKDPSFVPAITSIAATCGLIHDLGNPPFGHSGEVAISDWFREKRELKPDFFSELGQPSPQSPETQFAQDFLKFEGNAQTQRLLSKLQILADEHGLNLTCGTLSASWKYIARSNEIVPGLHEWSKHGFFASENDLFERLRKETGTGKARNPITYLVEASDDIVYSTVDLEDGVKKGILTWKMIESKLQEHVGPKKKPLERALAKAHKKIDKASLMQRDRDEAMSQAFRTFAIFESVLATIKAYKKNYRRIITGDYHGELLKDSDASGLISACKKIGRDTIYVSDETLKLEVLGRRVIHDLMELFWKAIREYRSNSQLTSFNAKLYKLTSANYRAVFEKNLRSSSSTCVPEMYFKLQLVTDHVSGMTDSYACALHKSLMNG
jgi:dGTPase